MILRFTGKVYKLGDNIDTDAIIPAQHLVSTSEKELAKHCFENLDKNFLNNVGAKTILVAGKNFGCGSSREHAPLAIKGCLIPCVIAETFARIFFRNSINIGLPILETSDAQKIQNGDELEVDIKSGKIKNLTRSETYLSQPFPGFMQEIISLGGLMNYIKKHLLCQQNAHKKQ